jgi:glycosyltransferase involved in cell wall biosynthesis
MRTKVAHVVWHGSFGGMTRALFQLVRAQKAGSAFDPVVIVANGDSEYFEELRSSGIEVFETGIPSDRHLHRAVAASRVFEQVPIHHFHATETTLALASLLARGSVRVFTHRTGIADHEGLRKARYRIARWYLSRYFHGFSGNTMHACRCASELFAVPLDRWQVTYNGLEFGMHDAVRSPEEIRRELAIGDIPVIGTAADLRDCKRVELLIEASARITTEHRLLVLGDGPLRGDLEALAARLGVADRALFVGVKPRIGDYLRIMDGFALPSTPLESFGNAVVEAMYQRVAPVIYSDSGGMLEHVVDDETGFVVSSVDEMASRLELLIRNAGERRRIGANAHHLVTERYTLPRMVAAYDDLYRVALERAKRR